MIDTDRIAILCQRRFCEPCLTDSYVVLSRVYDRESNQVVCLRCHNDILKAREEAARQAISY